MSQIDASFEFQTVTRPCTMLQIVHKSPEGHDTFTYEHGITPLLTGSDRRKKAPISELCFGIHCPQKYIQMKIGPTLDTDCRIVS